MAMKRNKTKIMSITPNKIIVKHGELPKVLTEDEIHQWNNIVLKIREYDQLYNVGGN